METTKYCGEPRHSVHRGSFVPGGLQTDYSSVRGGRLAAKAAPEPDTDHRNLRSRGSHELGPIGANGRARGFPRPRLRNTRRTHWLDCARSSATTGLAV